MSARVVFWGILAATLAGCGPSSVPAAKKNSAAADERKTVQVKSLSSKSAETAPDSVENAAAAEVTFFVAGMNEKLKVY